MKRTFALILSSLLLLLVFPTVRLNAETGKNWTVPEGYCEEDYDAAAAFLEQEDENGIKNGTRINRNYDPNNPETWLTDYIDDHGYHAGGIAWSVEEDGLKHVEQLYLHTMNNPHIQAPLSGNLDFSACQYLWAVDIGGTNNFDSILLPDSVLVFCSQGSFTITELDLASMGMRNVTNMAIDHNYRLKSIDVSCFEQLAQLWVFDCALTELDTSHNNNLFELMCYNNNLTTLNYNSNIERLICFSNQLTDLDLSNTADLRALQCNDNYIESLDLSHCSSLQALWTYNNPMIELDLQSCPNFEYLYDTKLFGFKELDLTGCIYYDFDHIFSEGNGTIGCHLNFDCYSTYSYLMKSIYAFPEPGEEFIGWYSDDGELLSTDEEFNLLQYGNQQNNYTARFTESVVTVPAGYSENDYLKLRDFLEQENDDGVKNGRLMNEEYDPNDPETWSYEGLFGTMQGVQWTEIEGTKYATAFTTDLWPDGQLQLAGNLDVSDCSQLTYLSFANNLLISVNASNTPMINAILTNNPITDVDFSGCTELYQLMCNNCELSELDLTDCIGLAVLRCSDCNLTSIDVSHCTELNTLECTGNPLTELDLTNNPLLQFNSIRAEGNGWIGLGQRWNDNFQLIIFAEAAPADGESFLGWYTEGGELISENEQLEWFYDTNETNVIARFTNNNQIPGDVDGSGEVNITDALLALRAAMGVIELTPEQLAAADMNGSGTAEVSDAIIILRMAMGLLN